MLDRVVVSSPARLHFGLFSIGNIADRQFGGVGLMIDRPRTRIVANKAESFSVLAADDELAKSIRIAAELTLKTLRSEIGFLHNEIDSLPVTLELQGAPPRHSGFGSGTQIALATAAAMFRIHKISMPSPHELASIVGRGKKSAIGTHGFGSGGFLVDRGLASDGTDKDSIASLDFRTEFPEPWRIVTIHLHETTGLSGTEESAAFRALQPTTEDFRLEMIEIVRTKMIPALHQKDIGRFGESVFEFGQKSGMMYADVQNGPYNGAEVQMLVSRIRELGIKGVGQSSWGPCVFAIVGNYEEAKKLKKELDDHYRDQASVLITRANNKGARTSTV